MVEINQIAQRRDGEIDDPSRSYRGATLLERMGWRSPGITFLTMSTAGDCICAKYTYPEYDIELRELLPNNHVDAQGNIYTERGRDAIVAHETRRIVVYALAYNVYFRKYEGGEKVKEFCADSPVELGKKINKLETEAISYINESQRLITEEDRTPIMVWTVNGLAFDGYQNVYRAPRPQPIE